jgi:hypothetical protein
VQDLQHNLVDRFRWFRLGLISATVMTPLVSRWQTLRAAERARTLWEASHAPMHLPWTHQPAEATELPPLARKSSLNTGVWLAGVLVGLFAAGTATYVLARRRQQSAGGLLDLPRMHANGNGVHPAGHAPLMLGRPRQAPEASRRHDDAATATAAPATTPAGAGTATGEQNAPAGAATTLASNASEAAAQPEKVRFIGNVHTRVYHQAGDENLPAEEHRVYFASAQEAESRGFRPDRGDVPPTKS